MPKITKVELTSFAYKLEGLSVNDGHNTVHKHGGVVNRTDLAIRIFDSPVRRWYRRFKLNFGHLVEMMVERNLSVSHTTIMRWVQRYAPELERRRNRFA